MQGLLDDPTYLKVAGLKAPPRQNVALLSAAVSALQLVQFVSLIAAPGGRGEPGPLRYLLSTHTLEHLDASSPPSCMYESRALAGDDRIDLARSTASKDGC